MQLKRTRLVEETEAHVLVLLFLLLGRLGLLLGSRSRSRGSGRSSSLRVGDGVLETSGHVEGVLGGEGDSQQVLVAVDHRVHDRGPGWVVGHQGDRSDVLDRLLHANLEAGVDGSQRRVVGGQGDGSNGGHGVLEGLQELFLRDVEHGGREGLTVVVDLLDTHTEGERRDVQHVQQRRFGSTDTSASLTHTDVRGNFNGTTGNLGRDTKGLEERSLTRFHTSVTSRDEHITWGDGTSTGRGSDTVGQDLVTGLLQVGVGEDETDVALDVREEALPLREVGNEGLDGTANLQEHAC